MSGKTLLMYCDVHNNPIPLNISLQCTEMIWLLLVCLLSDKNKFNQEKVSFIKYDVAGRNALRMHYSETSFLVR